MNYLIIGQENSGKSEYAEDLAVEISQGNPRVYLATMVPFGEEGFERINKHRKMRAGKGFITIEKDRNINKIIDVIRRANKPTLLLECVSNLVANEMHCGLYDLTILDSEEKEAIDNQIITTVYDQIIDVINSVYNCVIVSNEYEIKEDFDNETVRLCKLISAVNKKLEDYGCIKHEIINGKWIVNENS